MKKFAAFVMILSVSMFALGCNKPAAPAKKAGDTKAPVTTPETKPGEKPAEGGAAPAEPAPEKPAETK